MLLPGPLGAHGGLGAEIQPFPRFVLVGHHGHSRHADFVGFHTVRVNLMVGNKLGEILRRHQNGQVGIGGSLEGETAL